MSKFVYGMMAGLVFFLVSCATPASKSGESPSGHPTPSHPSAQVSPSLPKTQGLASWYGTRGRRKKQRRTANGERFDPQALTAAHRSLPFGTHVRVRALDTGKEVIVRINDRGPRRKSRLIDLSYAAGRVLGILSAGLARVEVQVLDPSVKPDLVW